MKILIDEDKIVFSSGRIYSANKGIIGLGPDGNIYDGYDGSLYISDETKEELQEWGHVYNKEDLSELADYMIEQWKKFKQGIEVG